MITPKKVFRIMAFILSAYFVVYLFSGVVGGPIAWILIAIFALSLLKKNDFPGLKILIVVLVLLQIVVFAWFITKLF